MAIISLLRDAANKIRRKPASEAKKTLSPFAKVKHLSAEYLPQLHVMEMKKAYRVSNPTPNVFEVKCREEHDRWHGSFHRQYIDIPEPVRKDKENITSPARLVPSAPKGHKFALARRPLLPIIPPPSTGPRRSSRGFLP